MNDDEIKDELEEEGIPKKNILDEELEDGVEEEVEGVDEDEEEKVEEEEEEE